MEGYEASTMLTVNCTNECNRSTSIDRDNSSSANLTVGPEFDQSLPVYGQILITIMCSIIIILSIGGNGIVCYTVLANKRMRTLTNMLILNMAMSDIAMAIFCMPFNLIYYTLLMYWPFGGAMCKIVFYIQPVSVYLSSFTLVVIAADRYVAIVYPFRPKMSAKQATLVIMGIWLLSVAFPLPSVIYQDIDIVTSDNREYEQCNEVWPEDLKTVYFSAYRLFLPITQYLIPLVILAFAYTRIACEMWAKKIPGEAQNTRDERMAESKRKVIKMMIAVVLVFGLCWLPLEVLTIVVTIHNELWSTHDYLLTIWLCCMLLAMSNCCYNPIIYFWMSTKFRNGFKYVLRFCPFVKYELVPPTDYTYKMMRAKQQYWSNRSPESNRAFPLSHNSLRVLKRDKPLVEERMEDSHSAVVTTSLN